MGRFPQTTSWSIDKDVGNDYVIAVKKNQPKLHRHIQRIAAFQKPTSRYVATEKTRNRVTTLTREVFHDLNGINPQWIGIKSLIRVERVGIRAGKQYHEIVCYISSLIGTAEEFACDIRGYWSIENCLYWVKDVVLKEDDSTIRLGNAPANLSILRAFALNILRRNGHTSITITQRFLSNDIDKLLALVEQNSPTLLKGVEQLNILLGTSN
ncbi:MAG: ISAs1 family transposase [Nostoc sp.]|uniref:ISAs1 family transposase n=1 Tax=Nostoc sp. TaxID=1180 RepID=UPI002FF6B713